MIGSILGAASGIYSAIKGSRDAKKQMQQAVDAVKESNKMAANSYNNMLGYNRASISGTLNKGLENMQKTLGGYAAAFSTVGGNNQAAEQLRDSAIAQGAEASRSAAQQVEQANQAAYSIYNSAVQANQKSLADIYTGQAKQSAAAASQGLKSGLSMIGSDLQSHLDTGKGMFEGAFGSIFKKKK